MRFGQNRIWLADPPRKRVMFRDHDALFIAYGRLRVRIFKPAWMGRHPL